MDQHDSILKTKIKQRKQVAGYVHYGSTYFKVLNAIHALLMICTAQEWQPLVKEIKEKKKWRGEERKKKKEKENL